MSTYRVPKCGRHFVKFDDVTIYPVLVVARTDNTYLILAQGLVVQNYWIIIKQLFTEVEVNIHLFHWHWGE